MQIHQNFLSIIFILTAPLETKCSAWSLWSSSHSAPKFIFGGIWSPTASLFNFGSSQNSSGWFSLVESKNYSFLERKNIFLWTVLEKNILSPLFFLIKRKKIPSCIRKIFKMKHVVFFIFYHSLPFICLQLPPFLRFSIQRVPVCSPLLPPAPGHDLILLLCQSNIPFGQSSCRPDFKKWSWSILTIGNPVLGSEILSEWTDLAPDTLSYNLLREEYGKTEKLCMCLHIGISVMKEIKAFIGCSDRKHQKEMSPDFKSHGKLLKGFFYRLRQLRDF